MARFERCGRFEMAGAYRTMRPAAQEDLLRAIGEWEMIHPDKLGTAGRPEAAQTRWRADRGPKRILSLDSGGFHSLISLAFLARMENVLRRQAAVQTAGRGRFGLSTYFDLIGGSSSGALVAAGLATGHSAEDMIDVLRDLARLSMKGRVPKDGRIRIDRAALLGVLHEMFGCTLLTDAKVETGLLCVTRRADTGRTELLGNVGPEQGRHATVADAVRASLGAGAGDTPESIRFNLADQGLYRDAGLGPHAHPGLTLSAIATGRGGGLDWVQGPDRLFLVSVGAGRWGPGPRKCTGSRGEAAAMADMTEVMLQSQASLVAAPAPVHDILGGVVPTVRSGGASFAYARYDLVMERSWLRDVLGRSVPFRELERLRSLSRFESIEPAMCIARDVAERMIRTDHFHARFAPNALG